MWEISLDLHLPDQTAEYVYAFKGLKYRNLRARGAVIQRRFHKNGEITSVDLTQGWGGGNAEISYIGRLAHVQEIYLGPSMPTELLTCIYKLKELKYIDLTAVSMTAKDRRALKEAFPNATIYSSYESPNLLILDSQPPK